MTENEFAVACEVATVLPGVALENEQIKEALQDKDDAAVKELLKTEF